jgi:predicted oxidoreductase
MIKRIKLAANSPDFSAMAYGTWRVLDEPLTPGDINQRLNLCVDLGITTIDTAEIYGGYRVEQALGEALALSPGLRGKIEIISKAGIYFPHPATRSVRTTFYDASAKQLIKSVEASLRLLSTEQLDLFLVHRPDWLTSVDETASGLNQLIKDGKIRAAGVSNYSATQFSALSSRVDQPLVTNQIEFSLFAMDPIYDGTFDQCQQNRVRPMAWSPLAGGKLFDREHPAAQRLAKEAAMLRDKYNGLSLEQLAYAWVMMHPSGAVPVIGTNKLDRIKSAAVAGNVVLDREDWYGLWVAAKGHGIP